MLSDYCHKITRKNKGNVLSNVLSNSANQGIISQSEYFDRAIANSNNTAGYYIIEQDDFVYNPRKSTAAPYGPVNVYHGGEPGIISPLYLCFKTTGINREFLFYYFKSKAWWPYMYENGDSGVRHDRVSIKDDVFFAMPIQLPPEKEQLKIAQLLSLIDQRIAVQNKVIEKYESLIKALAHKIIGKNAPNTMLSECVCCASSTLKERDLSDAGAVPAYGAAGISGFIDSALSDGDSILITKDGSGVGSLRYVVGLHSFVGTLNSMTPKEGVYLPYIYYALQNVCFECYRTGQAIPHIYFKDYGKEALYCPSFDDQKRLAKGLEMIDAKIGNERTALQNLQLVKAYLLSAMFI